MIILWKKPQQMSTDFVLNVRECSVGLTRPCSSAVISEVDDIVLFILSYYSEEGMVFITTGTL